MNQHLITIANSIPDTNTAIKIQEMNRFFQEQHITIPAGFVDRFISNAVNENVWVSSEQLFEWFQTVSPNYKYNDFLVKLRKISKQDELVEQNENISHKQKGRPHKIYLVSQDAMKRFMMKADDNVCDYYITLNDAFKKYHKAQETEHKIAMKLIEEQNTQYQTFIGQLSKYKETLEVQHFLFQDYSIRIQGTKEDPLFNCLDIAKVLGYNQANQNKFYQRNKTNPEYVSTLTNSQGPQQLASAFEQCSAKETKFFTETGLYECLFASDKPVARQFRKEIIQMLKNIRLGVIGLQILDEQQYKRQIQEKNSQLTTIQTCMQEYQLKLTDLSDQVDSLTEANQQQQQIIKSATKTCVLYKEKVLDNQGQVQAEYAGSTTQKPHLRDRQHRSNSCNKQLKQAIQEGKRVEFEQIGSFQYVDENERKQKERELILSIDSSKRLNIQLPRVK